MQKILKYKKWILTFILSIFINGLTFFSAWADKDSFPVQGFIVDKDTETPLEGSFEVTFNFYDGCDSSNPIFSVIEDLPFTAGIFAAKVLFSSNLFAGTNCPWFNTHTVGGIFLWSDWSLDFSPFERKGRSC